jgi:hypothetical protein
MPICPLCALDSVMSTAKKHQRDLSWQSHGQRKQRDIALNNHATMLLSGWTIVA